MHSESVFLLMMAAWTAQKNEAGVDLIKSELVEVSYSYICQDFYRHILDEKTLLEASRECALKTSFK